ncbi:hypothetical protein A2U01_0049529, partial [Trifolium medium]|nr:hypothetical protein [Trifolium medium]
MQMFTQGLRPQTRMILDASAGGSLKNKDEDQAKDLVETMAQNEYRANNDRGAKKKGGVLELDIQNALLAQSKLMTNTMESLLKHFTNPPSHANSQVNQLQELRCDFCTQAHANGGCFPEGSEEARYLANFRKSYPNNQNYGWGNNQAQTSSQDPPPPRH